MNAKKDDAQQYYRAAGKIRREIRELLDTAMSEAAEHDVKAPLLAEVLAWYDRNVPPPTNTTEERATKPGSTFPLVVFNDREAEEFSMQVVNFGKYSGTRWKDIPHYYLEWMRKNNSALLKYLYSDYYRRELAADASEDRDDDDEELPF